jgi:hypothetical protein
VLPEDGQLRALGPGVRLGQVLGPQLLGHLGRSRGPHPGVDVDRGLQLSLGMDQTIASGDRISRARSAPAWASVSSGWPCGAGPTTIFWSVIPAASRYDAAWPTRPSQSAWRAGDPSAGNGPSVLSTHGSGASARRWAILSAFASMASASSRPGWRVSGRITSGTRSAQVTVWPRRAWSSRPP